MHTEPTKYEVLGIQRDATPDEIKSAFRQQVKRNHPDQGGNPALFRMVEDAYETLINPGTRAAYDASMGMAPATPPHGVPPVAGGNPVDSAPRSREFVFIGEDQAAEPSRWEKLKNKRIPWKRIVLVVALLWLAFALFTEAPAVPGVDGLTAAWIAFWLFIAWVLGSFVLRLTAWIAAIGSLADAYLNDVPVALTAGRLALAFAVWLCGQWLYTFRRGQWHSIVAHQILGSLPGPLRPDRRWDGGD